MDVFCGIDWAEDHHDIALAGLNHKLGWRGTTNTLLNFGEGKFPVRGAGGGVRVRDLRLGAGTRRHRHRLPDRRADLGSERAGARRRSIAL